jgi:hypothetical protein
MAAYEGKDTKKKLLTKQLIKGHDKERTYRETKLKKLETFSDEINMK